MIRKAQADRSHAGNTATPKKKEDASEKKRGRRRREGGPRKEGRKEGGTLAPNRDRIGGAGALAPLALSPPASRVAGRAPPPPLPAPAPAAAPPPLPPLPLLLLLLLLLPLLVPPLGLVATAAGVARRRGAPALRLRRRLLRLSPGRDRRGEGGPLLSVPRVGAVVGVVRVGVGVVAMVAVVVGGRMVEGGVGGRGRGGVAQAVHVLESE